MTSAARIGLALAALSLPARLFAQLSPAELEDAAETARRLASGAARRQERPLAEAFDADRILAEAIGREAWERLTARQRESLRKAAGESFARALAAGPRSGPGEVVWSASRADGTDAVVFLGVRWEQRLLKTRWTLRRAGPGWRVSDVVLSDPGISLAAVSRRSLGFHPVRERDRREEARREAAPRLLGLAAIGLAVAASYKRLAPPRRRILLLTAAAPAFLFAVDGALAVRRALAERYSLALPAGAPDSERWLRLARDTEQEGRSAQAESLWARAIEAGAGSGPVAYERGIAARDRGETARARELFRTALEAAAPAPGAAKELALLDLSEGKNDVAAAELSEYLERTGPDPEALSLLAVAETNRGEARRAVEAIRRARELVGQGARGAELEAKIRARAGDAAGAVAALRETEAGGTLDFESLRSDPAYLPIATDPEWIAFVNGEPASAPPPARSPRTK